MARLYPKVSANASSRTVILEKRQLDAVLAVQIFLIESKLQHKDRILPLLLNLLKSLPSIKFNEASELRRISKGCLAEEFSYHFVLLLLKIASLEGPNGSNDIILALLHLFKELIQTCCDIGDKTDVEKGMNMIIFNHLHSK